MKISNLPDYVNLTCELRKLFDVLFESYVNNMNPDAVLMLSRLLLELRKAEIVKVNKYYECIRTINRIVLSIKPPKVRKATISTSFNIRPYTMPERYVLNELKRRYDQVKTFHEENIPEKLIQNYLKNREKEFPIMNAVSEFTEYKEYKYLYANDEPRQLMLWGLDEED